jgi:Tat protein secretion system quality control protein TatD with DNase activity
MAALLENLDPCMVDKAKAYQDACAKLPFKSVLAETDRDFAKQNAVFKQGYSKCDGVRSPSMHQARLAFDQVVLDGNGNRTWDYAKYAKEYRALADLATTFGFENGADWQPDPKTGLGWDPPHHQFKG